MIPEIDNLDWSEVRPITTRNKEIKLMKSAPPSEQFWNLYREQKPALQSAGFSLSKFSSIWSVNWWARQGGEFAYPVIGDVISKESVNVDESPMTPVPLVNKKGMLPYQETLVQQVVASMKRHNASLNGCGTGVGKTYITLFAAREMGAKLLIICPKGIVTDWKRAAIAAGVEIVGAFGWEWMKTGKTPFLSWSMKRKANGEVTKDKMQFNIPKGVCVVFDEAHRAGAMDSQNADMLEACHRQGVPIFMLTATLANDPTRMRAPGKVLGLHRGGASFYSWMKTHGVVEKMFGRRKVYQFAGSSRHLNAINASIFPRLGCRVTAKDLGDAFPASQVIAKSYDMEESREISLAYQEMEAECERLEASFNGSASEKKACILAEIMRARRKIEILKVPLFVSLTRDALEEGNSVFITVNFTATLEELVRILKAKCWIRGGQKDDERRGMIDSFQRNDQRVIIGNIKACREGLNLHDIHGGHPRMALIMPTPSAFDLKQVLGRVHRVGGLTPSIQRIVYAAGTIEESVCENLATKLDQLDLLMDGELQGRIFPSGYSAMRPATEEEE